MAFWNDLSGGTKMFVGLGAVLMLVILAVRSCEPDPDAPVPPPGIPPSVAQPQ